MRQGKGRVAQGRRAGGDSLRVKRLAQKSKGREDQKEGLVVLHNPQPQARHGPRAPQWSLKAAAPQMRSSPPCPRGHPVPRQRTLHQASQKAQCMNTAACHSPPLSPRLSGAPPQPRARCVPPSARGPSGPEDQRQPMAAFFEAQICVDLGFSGGGGLGAPPHCPASASQPRADLTGARQPFVARSTQEEHQIHPTFACLETRHFYH